VIVLSNKNENSKTLCDGYNKILQASIKVFARKSFEGSRIEEIAKEAGVPKSLIYYHFKNKDEILQVLTDKFANEFSELIKIAENDTHKSRAEKLSERLSGLYVEFEKRNADLIRIMLIESLKKNKEKPILFGIVEAIINTEKKFPVNKDKAFNTNESLAAEFFTRLIPNYAYICFSDAWSEYFKIEKSELDNQFVKLMVETHGAYHKNHE
jgi:AcrR family transcriptional regulator